MEKTGLSKDSEFFFSFITFQVDSCLFKVLRKPFMEESQIFRDMFDLPETEDTVSDGMDEAHPLRLDGIKSDEFRPFLRALHATQHHSPLSMSPEEWLSVLKLAHMWSFTELREWAINRLDSLDSSSMDAIQKIHIAREYEIPGWVRKAYEELVIREDSLTDEEVERLGWRDGLMITRFREERKEKLLAHFTSGHLVTRSCTAGHDNDIHWQPYCSRPTCHQRLKKQVTDGCEIFTFKDVE